MGADFEGLLMVSISNVDKYRMDSLKSEWEVKSLRLFWPDIIQPEIRRALGSDPSSESIMSLGDNLRNIWFQFVQRIIDARCCLRVLGYPDSITNPDHVKEAIELFLQIENGNASENQKEAFKIEKENRSNRRDQSGLSQSGKVFECLTSWYLNILFWNTPVVVGSAGKNRVPDVLRDVTTVNVNNSECNSETDVFAFSIPDADYFSYTGIASVNEWLVPRLSKVNLTMIQTKTNWKDNVQIPMLWNLIYKDKLIYEGVRIGRNGQFLESLESFSYAFITIPSGKGSLDEICAPHERHVLRVQQMSGGNYWCASRKENVAKAIYDFPDRNFKGIILRTPSKRLWGHVQENLQKYPNMLDSFLNLNFDKMV